MAQGVGLGLDLSKIDQQLTKLNGQFDQLIKKGAQFKNVWDASFKNMGEGGLKAFAQELANLKKNVVDFGKQKVGVKWDSASLQKYMDDVQRLILVIKQVQKETKGNKDIKGVNIIGLKKELKEAQELLRLAKHREKEEKDIQTRIANARAQAKKREEDLDKQAYQTWLAQKHKEEKEQKRIEEAKTRATQQAIARQNAEYKKQEEIVRQAHLASQRAK
jgi:hypothetical protein